MSDVPAYKPPTAKPTVPPADHPANPLDLDTLEDQATGLGQRILNELRAGYASIQLSPVEAEIAVRAAQTLAECQILAIGATGGTLQNVKDRTQRAVSTLIQLYAGEAVAARLAVQNTILAVIKQVVRTVIEVISAGAL